VVDGSISDNFSGPGWEEIDCILCGETATRRLWPDSQRGHIVRCCRCGLVFRNPRRREEAQTWHFAEERTESLPLSFVQDRRLKNLVRLAGWILKYHPEPGNILDIGSSYGTLLAQFPSSWQRVGIEPSRTACQVAQTHLPDARFINSTLATAPLPEVGFDCITMIDTIYYLPYPLRDLAKLSRLLKSDGIALIEAPNFVKRLHFYKWLGRTFPASWMYFYNPDYLEKVLNKAGLQVVDKFYLPSNLIADHSFWKKYLAWSDYHFLQIIRNLSLKKIDYLSYFVLIAKKN
jgi:SAM-dependent methyltransferase